MRNGRICKIASWEKKDLECETFSEIIDAISLSQCHGGENT